jgi:uncharacterized membrane protein YbhN (UPF0104 family)
MSMNEPVETSRGESRWPPVLTLLGVLVFFAMLPHRVHLLPVWIFWVAAFAVIAPMAAVELSSASTRWLRAERTMIIALALLYLANTSAELADVIGIITVRPRDGRLLSLLSSSVVIWVSNVVVFSMLYWQVDGGGPGGRASKSGKPDWVFPQPASPEDVPPGWQPFFFDYLFLAYNTATAFSPTDALPLTRRAKMLMMIESMISLLTIVIVASRAVGVLP